MAKAGIKPYTKYWSEKPYHNTSTIFRLSKNGQLPGVGVDYVIVEKGKRLQPHYHHLPHVLILVLKGKGFVYLNGKEKPAKEGDVITIPPKTTHGFRATTTKLVFVSIQNPPIYGKEAKKDTYFID